MEHRHQEALAGRWDLVEVRILPREEPFVASIWEGDESGGARVLSPKGAGLEGAALTLDRAGSFTGVIGQAMSGTWRPTEDRQISMEAEGGEIGACRLEKELLVVQVFDEEEGHTYEYGYARVPSAKIRARLERFVDTALDHRHFDKKVLAELIDGARGLVLLEAEKNSLLEHAIWECRDYEVATMLVRAGVTYQQHENAIDLLDVLRQRPQSREVVALLRLLEEMPQGL